MSAFKMEEVKVDAEFDTLPEKWLLEQAQRHSLHNLLAHADDGVIWGRILPDGLQTSTGIADTSPALRTPTLWQLRLFGPNGELLLWRAAAGWRGRIVQDDPGRDDDSFDEDQILWGTEVVRAVQHFTLVQEGQQGMRHAVPVDVTDEQLKQRKLRLRVRHYIAYGAEDGAARVALSRLVCLLPESK